MAYDLVGLKDLAVILWVQRCCNSLIGVSVRVVYGSSIFVHVLALDIQGHVLVDVEEAQLLVGARPFAENSILQGLLEISDDHVWGRNAKAVAIASIFRFLRANLWSR